MLIISELRFRKRFGNLMHGVDLRKRKFLVFCKTQIISLLRNIGRMRIVDFFARVYSQRDKIDICEKFPILQNGLKRLISHIISHIAKTHIFARDFLYGYYFVVICVYNYTRGCEVSNLKG